MRGAGGGGPRDWGGVRFTRDWYTMLDSSKMETPEAYFFDIATAQNDSPMYLTHILDSIYVLSTSFVQSVPWGRGGGGPKGLVQNLLMQLFTLGSSKIKVCQPPFLDIVTAQNGHPRYAKRVLSSI